LPICDNKWESGQKSQVIVSIKCMQSNLYKYIIWSKKFGKEDKNGTKLQVF